MKEYISLFNVLKTRASVLLSVGLAICVFGGLSVIGQTAAQYTFVRTAGAYASISGTGTPAGPGILSDDGCTGSIPFGFTFNFAGANYTSATACANGVLSLANGGANYIVAASNINGPGFLMPIWNDNSGLPAGNSTPSAFYQTTGSPGSRVFTMEWKSWNVCCIAPFAMNFQVKLYEGINNVEFAYGPRAGSPNGVAGIANSTSDYQTLTSTASSVTNTSFNFTPMAGDGSILTFSPPPSLAITNTDGTTTAIPGTTTTYTIIASKAGSGTASNATVTDAFPAGITAVSWTCSASGGATCGAASGSGDINQTSFLPPGGSLTYVAVASISINATGTLTNTATLTGTAPAESVSATDADTLTPIADLAISKTDSMASVPAGSITTYSIVVSNLGPGPAVGARVVDVLPAAITSATWTCTNLGGAICSNAAGNGNIDQAVDLPVGGSIIYMLAATINAGATGTLANTATVTPSAGFPDPNPANNSATDTDTLTPTLTPTPTPTPLPPAASVEGDINRTVIGQPGTGDKDVNVGDQIQYIRFFRGTDCPAVGTSNPALNEQQRYDAGPRGTAPPLTLGDGSIGASDGTAIDAYARHDAMTDFDPNLFDWQPTPAGGPTTITGLNCTPTAEAESDNETASEPEPESATAARVVRVVPGTANHGDITVEIEMTAQGNEAGTQYSLHFDPTALSISDVSGVNSNPDISSGADSPAGTTLNVNAQDAANGNIGIVENFNAASDSITAIPEGARRIARVTFHVRSGATAGESAITFGDAVVKGLSADTNGLILGTNFDQNGRIVIPATAGVTISGRVTTPEGRGVRGATVTIVDRAGFARTVTTSSFGYYTFDDLSVGVTYTIGVASRQYRFGSRTLELADNLTGVDFAGSE